MPGKRRRGKAPTTDPIQPLRVAPPKSRGQVRADRRRQQRKRIGAVGIAGLVALGVAAAVGIGFGVHTATSGHHHETPGQSTLLFSVVGADHSALETALLAHDPKTHQGVELLIPRRVLTEVCGFGNQQLDQIPALPHGQDLHRAAVSDLLGGVSVDGSWLLTPAQLSRLIDEVGGITADVDVAVTRAQAGGGRVLLVPKGRAQHLTGARAVVYATYLAPGEEAIDNLVRLQSVLDGLLAALPTDASKVQHLVSTLGPGATSSLGAARLADTLASLAADRRSNNVLPTDLPVEKIDAGTSPAYRVDAAQTQSFVSANLAASRPTSAGQTRKKVFVQNGVGTPGLVGTACTRLVKAGFAFAGSGNAAQFGHAKSQVLVFNRSVASAQLGNSVARALGLPTSDVAVSSEGQNVADVLVILGKDYRH